MSTHNVFDNNQCPCGPINDPIVDKLLGNAYQVVKYVAMNMPAIKVVSDEIASILAVYAKLKELSDIQAKIPELMGVQAALPHLEILHTNLSQLLTLYTHIDELVKVATGIGDIHVITPHLQELATVAANITEVVATGTNITKVIAVANSIASVNKLSPVVAEIDTLAQNVQALVNINTHLPELLNINHHLPDLLNIETPLSKLVINSFEALRRTYSEAGLALVTGSFEDGAKVTTKQDVVLERKTGKGYNWQGSIPSGGKIIPAGSTPASTGGVGADKWQDLSNITYANQREFTNGKQYTLYRAFEAAVTLTQVNEAVQFTVGGIFYRWDGVFPHGGLVIPQDTPEPSPDQTGAGKYIAVLDLAVKAYYSDKSGSSRVGFIHTGSGAQERTSESKMRDIVSIRDFGARSTTEAGCSDFDSTSAIQNALLSHRNVYVPPGDYKVSARLDIPASTRLYGAGRASKLHIYGTDGIHIGASMDAVRVESMSMFSYTSGGEPDTRSFSAIMVEGAQASAVNALTFNDLYLQGWATCIYGKYLWSSRFGNISTVNSNVGILLQGQCVNNSVSDSHLVVNAGEASIKLIPDGPIIGEGLSITNTLMASGTYGIKAGVGFLSLHISNSIIDLIADVALKLSDVRSLHCVGNWIFAKNKGIEFAPLGTIEDQAGSIVGNTIEVTSDTAGRGVDIGGANKGINIIGGSIKVKGSSQGVYVDGTENFIAGVYFINTGSGASICLNTVSNTIGACTGKVTVVGGYHFEHRVGEWIPDISADGLGVTKFNKLSAKGTYTKIGRQVTIVCEYAYNGTGSVAGAYAAMSGLPFTPDPNAGNPTVFCAINQEAFDSKTYQAVLSSGLIYFQNNNGEGTLYDGSPRMLGSNFPSAGTVRFVMTYFSTL